MIKKHRLPFYHHKENMLTGWGFLPFEYRELSMQYTTSQLRSLPYLHNLMRSRRLFVSNLRKRGYKDSEIRDRVYALYDKKDWLTDGKPDIWKLLRTYRKKAIDTGDYIAPKRKGSHHKDKGVSKGDVEEQRQRRKERSKTRERDEMNDRIVQAYRTYDTTLAHKLEAERNRRFGY